MWVYPLQFEKVNLKKGFVKLSTRLDFFSFLSGFSFTDTDNSRTAGKRRRPSIIPLYHFHPLTYIQIFATLLVR